MFAKRVFRWAGVYGLLVVGPQVFLEAKTGRDFPPAITHPEYYYGFIGTVVAFQVAFLIIAADPVRYRPLMIPSILEKAFFGLGMPILFLQHRVPGVILVFSTIDVLLGVLFAVAWVRTSAGDRR